MSKRLQIVSNAFTQVFSLVKTIFFQMIALHLGEKKN